MTVDTKRNPDGSVDLLIDGRVAISGESVQVVDNIAWALRHPSNGGVYDVSEADEVAESITSHSVSDVLHLLAEAVERVRITNAEGNPILSAWLPEAEKVVRCGAQCDHCQMFIDS